ncbi:MAG: alpha/beta hydrolase [Actinomycetota bacterium]|nr:alpha/beta hydrolase [Actinomycetota bacterium]MDQ3629647.1 alpha/beta hydrolase [Actinomycetota bacterium]
MSSALGRPHVFLPGDPVRPSVPLLMLHGTGGDEHDLLPLAQRLSPTSPVLSPRGSVLEGAMPRFFARLAEGVFDEDDLRERTDELADFVLAASTEHDVDPASWMAVGFSNGANIAASLLMRRPEVLTGATLLAAMVPYARPPSGADLSGHRVVVSNGRQDPMATPQQTERLVGQLRVLGAQVDELPHPGGHTIDSTLLPRIAELISSGPCPLGLTQGLIVAGP